MLIAPCWGGMINGLLTLRGAWDKLRVDPILKFFVAGITFYGMATFEGPMMSVRSINALSHYTDYTVGHVHAGALGWNGFITFAMIYYLLPKLWRVEVYSKRLMATHFWLATIGIVLYITSMWTAGITQGLMWRAFADNGMLQYPDFIETVLRLKPFYIIRALGGGLFLVGTIIAAYNIVRTIMIARARSVDLSDTPAQAKRFVIDRSGTWHHRLEGMPITFTILTLIAVLIGGIIEIVPMLAIASNVPTIASVKPSPSTRT